jgi:Domain of unknown function (DUF3883)
LQAAVSDQIGTTTHHYPIGKHPPNLLYVGYFRAEFKHANTSAVLIELGFPYISGYKPRSNYQSLLFEVVSERLAGQHQLLKLAAEDVERSIVVPTVDDILKVLTDPPKPAVSNRRADEPTIRPYAAARPRLAVNYLERESRNNALGLAGEEFVINFEQARLIKARQERLASKIVHVARDRGDGEGYDVLSYEASGIERLIEVKTTKYGRETPFFVSRNEVGVSQKRAKHYHLYRLFEFRNDPRLFMLRGALSDTCSLDPTSYIARVA